MPRTPTRLLIAPQQNTRFWEFVSTPEVAPESARGSDAEAAIWLRIWITEQEQLRADTSAQQEVRGRLDQLLAGRELTEWEAEEASLAAASEPEPARHS